MLPRDREEAIERRNAVESMLEAAKQKVSTQPPDALSSQGVSPPMAAWTPEPDGPAIVELLTQIHGTSCFLGVRTAADDAALLESHGIASVIVVGSSPQPCSADVMSTMAVRLGDMSSDPLLGHLPKAFTFIDEAIENGALLIYSEDEDGEAGAAALCVAWLMARRGVPWPEAPKVVEADRPSAKLNKNYEKQLRVWSKWKEFPGLPEWL